MEPLIPVKLTEFDRALLVLSGRIFDMPKSPTRALIVCKKDVAWFEITMNYWWLALVMKIIQRVHDINSNT